MRFFPESKCTPFLDISEFWWCWKRSSTILTLPALISHCFILIEGKRKGVHLQVKKGEFIVFFHVLHRTCRKDEPLIMSSFLIQMQTCNNQPKIEGMSRKLERGLHAMSQITNKYHHQMVAIREWSRLWWHINNTLTSTLEQYDTFACS